MSINSNVFVLSIRLFTSSSSLFISCCAITKGSFELAFSGTIKVQPRARKNAINILNVFLIFLSPHNKNKTIIPFY
jgi:hypothetical protein